MTSTNSWTGKGLNGTPSNIENMQIIPSAGLAWIFYQYLCNRSTFGFEFELLRIKPCSFILYQWRAENGWLMMSYTSATHVSLVHDITKTARHKIVSSRHCTPVPYMPVLFVTSHRLLDTKWLAHDIVHQCHTCQSCWWYHTDCQIQNGHAHNCIFTPFKS